ncbi:GntR family transcriptional regulator [Octadecabacter antarcticus 307]|uniref:GntR family transcriptional regulator n=1 Tax=Octadecabacter antarcticus 307 TaxID=391626 RepID=M9RDZ2_9RHOB|nr:GntR family transcriptional regulator [Octadecabacter antarcticus]AGI68636.1 GntR family transcriptional regulator [Octadecabacter antarcticus 307]
MTMIERPKQISEIVTDRLRSDIVNGTYQLGEKLSEKLLSQIYGVTKAPIRAAFRRLQTEGLIDIRAQSGTYVFKLETQQLTSLCHLRTALELEAVHLALQTAQSDCHARLSNICLLMTNALKQGQQDKYQKLDTDFHLALFQAAQSPLLLSTFEAQVSSTFAALRHHFAKIEPQIEASMNEHIEICNLVKLGDLKSLNEVLRLHIENSRVYYNAVVGG